MMGRESRWKPGTGKLRGNMVLEDPHREAREVVALFMSGKTEAAVALMRKHQKEDDEVIRERNQITYQQGWGAHYPHFQSCECNNYSDPEDD